MIKHQGQSGFGRARTTAGGRSLWTVVTVVGLSTLMAARTTGYATPADPAVALNHAYDPEKPLTLTGAALQQLRLDITEAPGSVLVEYREATAPAARLRPAPLTRDQDGWPLVRPSKPDP